jgi:nitrate reductase gamma subunit
MSALQYFIYLSVIVMVVGILIKAIKIAKMPMHLRWDLYPIPHEKGKNKYGGSYFEEVDWWTKPANFSMASEIKEMSKEILFIQSLYHHNRPLWIFSFPFHFGLYLLIGFVAFLLLGAILNLSGVAVTAEATGFIPIAVYALTIICGVAGAILGAFGAFGLLLSRIFKSELRLFSVKSDYFNLLLLLSIFVLLLASWLISDKTFELLRSVTAGLITFQPVASLPPTTHLFLVLSALFSYIFPSLT